DLGIGVAHDQDQPLAVGAPGVVVDPAFDLGHLLRLPARAVEEPELGRLVVVLAPPGGEEREVAAVRAPAGLLLAVRARGEAHAARAVPRSEEHTSELQS